MSEISKARTTLLSLILLLAFFWWASLYGSNFGFHWDENRAKFDSVRKSLETGIFLQSVEEPDGFSYNYGGVNYLLTWLGFTPEIITYLHNGNLTREALSAAITPMIYATAARLRVRAIYVFLSSLSILWLFYLTIVLGRSRLESFLAATILAASWEIAYHSRWIAPDVVMMQFAALAFLCLAIGVTQQKVHAFYWGAIAIGLAAGTKYPGILVLPFFLLGATAVVWQQHRSVLSVLKNTIALAAISGLTFAITTPGAVVDPFRFFFQVTEQQDIYSKGFYGYSVSPGLPHLLAVLKYFAFELFSPFPIISILFALCCFVGIVSLLQEFKIMTLLMTGFVLAHLVLFAAGATLIVRNLLVAAPFLCMAAARGITVAVERLNAKSRVVVYGVVGMLLAANLGWQVYAARQIKLRMHREVFLKAFVDYAEASPKETFLVSRRLLDSLHTFDLTPPGNVVATPGTSYTRVAFLQTEGPDVYSVFWPSNWWGMYERVFGSLEVNLDAYPTFIGNDRILVVSTENFKQLPIKEKDILRDPAQQ